VDFANQVTSPPRHVATVNLATILGHFATGGDMTIYYFETERDWPDRDDYQDTKIPIVGKCRRTAFDFSGRRRFCVGKFGKY